MCLTADELAARDQLVLAWHREFEVPLAVLYGGGYNKQPQGTAELHASTIRLAIEEAERSLFSA